jgi:CheY-like chemotaxis protein
MFEITARAAIEGGVALKGLLSFARVRQLRGSEIVDIGELLRDAARLTAPRWRDAAQAEGRPISLFVEAEPGCAVEGSPASLREALTNLIFNAVDALPSGGTIRLRSECMLDTVVVEVMDSGVGIPPDIQLRVFDLFFTTKGERGTGLGLAQVRSIVERSRGTIQLDSTPGKGTTFRLVFPAAKATAGEEPTPTEGFAPSAPRAIRILVVDDEVQLARMASLALSQRGHRVSVAQSAEEALLHLERAPCELLISDLGLGAGMNGWDLAQQVKQRWPGIRFVLVTGWGAAISPEDARARGVDEVLAKPYRINELRQIAERVALDETDARPDR